MKAAILVILLTAAAVAMIPVTSANACTCVLPVTPEEAYNEADAVFRGFALGYTQVDSQMKLFNFLVMGQWKGNVPQLVSVYTPDNGAGCGYEFDYYPDPTEFLVYAENSGDPNYPGLFTHLCTRNAPAWSAQEDLDWLGPASGPVPLEVLSWGVVKKRYEE